jgi:hypothetical protein
MAYPEPFPSFVTPRPAPAAERITVPVPQASVPHGALARLPQLQAESQRALARARLLARAVPAAGLLLAMGAPAALMGGAPLATAFVWSAMVLAGIAAIVHNHLRGQVSLAGSTADLTALLLYMGFAWGTGAFLALAPGLAFWPLVLTVFAALPSLAMALLLRDARAAAFIVPVALLALAAALARDNYAAAALLLLLEGAILLLVLRRHPGMALPAGLTLR